MVVGTAQTWFEHFSDKKHSWLWELPGVYRIILCMDWWRVRSVACIQKEKARKRPTVNFAERNGEYKDWIERNGEI